MSFPEKGYSDASCLLIIIITTELFLQIFWLFNGFILLKSIFLCSSFCHWAFISVLCVKLICLLSAFEHLLNSCISHHISRDISHHISRDISHDIIISYYHIISLCMTVSHRLSGVCVFFVTAACISNELTCRQPTCCWLVTHLLGCLTVTTHKLLFLTTDVCPSSGADQSQYNKVS